MCRGGSKMLDPLDNVVGYIRASSLVVVTDNKPHIGPVRAVDADGLACNLRL